MSVCMPAELHAPVQRRRLLWLGPTTALLVATVPLRPSWAKAPEQPTCVSFRTEVRYSVGYDHLVHVTNECSRPVACTVRTDVNPSDLSVRVAPRTTETVLTFR